MTKQPEDEITAGGSPACAMHEADDAYMGYAAGEELIAFLDELLEAERAGTRVAGESADAASGDRIAALMRAIARDEARWCAMLFQHIKALGAAPSPKVGAFYDEAMAIADLGERIAFLDRCRGRVVRKLREMLPRVRSDALHRDLTLMLQSHEANIVLAGEVAPVASDRNEVPAVIAADALPPRARPTNYPEPFASRMAGRVKKPLGDVFGLKNFGVNLTRLPPGAVSALHHRHSRQEEFIYVLEGEPTLHNDRGTVQLRPGMCAGFPAGGTAHHLSNGTASDVVVLEIGDRTIGDAVSYPEDDIQALMGPDGQWRFTHKDGTPY